MDGGTIIGGGEMGYTTVKEAVKYFKLNWKDDTPLCPNCYSLLEWDGDDDKDEKDYLFCLNQMCLNE